jgi:hypothetical protein
MTGSCARPSKQLIAVQKVKSHPLATPLAGQQECFDQGFQYPMKVPTRPPKSTRQNIIYRWTLIILGSVFVGLGFIGVFVPLLPTTPFLLLAAACYFKSSEKFYNWLIDHRWFGPYLRNYREGKRFSGKQKAALVVLIALTVISSALMLMYFSA